MAQILSEHLISIVWHTVKQIILKSQRLVKYHGIMNITSALEIILMSIDPTGLTDYERNAYDVLWKALEREQKRNDRSNGFAESDFYQ